MADVDPSGSVSKLPLLMMGAVVTIAALVTIALVAVRGPTTYAPGSPEAAVQDFVQAGFDDDMSTVMSMLTDESRAECEIHMDRSEVDDNIYTSGLRAELEDISVTSDTAVAEVRFRQGSSSDPFDNSGWSYDEQFNLIEVEGDWLVDRAGWPHQISDCTSGRR